ncbi:IQ and AAA domain-containing protein 1-like [Asbolus verrucosus]|uniref:IQ and AAA domain-containing protein 1-like n=1 Tax=Asbolus verrucosus TaxID=1661398 RepID=A0A482W8T4_ASBVE|nr:IQ and AAA domain-containing protein 1-like [Asbolus verrucosus]
MYEPSWKSKEEFEKLERNLQKRRDMRDERIKEYIEANLNERTRLEAALKKKEKEKLKKELERKRKKRLKPWEFELEYEPTTTKDPFSKAFDEYQEIFHDRKDEDNPSEKHYMDIIHEEKCYEMQLEIRKQVDELMRLELEMLEDALAQDRAKRKGKKYKKKKKKKKKHKKKKKKGKKDPTGHRSVEDLFQELVDNGIIHPYNKQYLNEYKGDFSYNNWEYRSREFDPPSTLGDVRQVVKINCIAPLSTESMIKPKSVLLIGPRQSGKHLLANAVFTESQSILFDLSPEVLAGKYPGNKACLTCQNFYIRLRSFYV